ncbi:MAG: hypothetical protein A2201_01050 [Alicyclobacillus sp. RIFOXYA1_FULL_53_8]|nr:MAG: hypothetical protein A2201_01050 [Alicyclobacillus sp. RIFOXYA1_FULL_53_8]
MSTISTAGMHPLLSSVVHLPFQKAGSDVGCSEFTFKHFQRAIQAHLHILSAQSAMNELEQHKTWQALMHGEVIAVECLDDETLVFHVRGKTFGKYVDMRFAYLKEMWYIQAVTSIHDRPFWRSRLRYLLSLGGGVVAAASLGFALANHGTTPVTQQGASDWAVANGYELVKKTPPVLASSPPAKATLSETKAASPNPTYVFTFKLGMPVTDISSFLQKQHLINDAYAFDQVLKASGADKSIWPGTYTFTSGMSQNQILQVLKSKPTH